MGIQWGLSPGGYIATRLTAEGNVVVANYVWDVSTLAWIPSTYNGAVSGTEVSVVNFPASYPVTDNGGSLTVDGTVALTGTSPISGSVSLVGTSPVSGTITVSDGVGIKIYDTVSASYVGNKFVDGKFRTSSMPYLYDIAEGNVTGHTEWERFGFNADIDITEEDVWTSGGTYTFPVSGQQMELVSTSVQDTLTTGTGIQIVTIYYLTDTYVAKTENVGLSGTTAVTTSGNDIFRVNAVKAYTVGTGGVSAGIISVRHTSDTPVYSQIGVGQTRSRNSVYTVPTGKTLYITSMTVGCGAAAATTALVTLRAKYDHDLGSVVTYFLPHAEMQVGAGGGGFYRPFEIPIKLPAGVDIKCSASTTANNTAVSVGMRGWLE